jgi:hypothetical protein
MAPVAVEEQVAAVPRRMAVLLEETELLILVAAAVEIVEMAV